MSEKPDFRAISEAVQTGTAPMKWTRTSRPETTKKQAIYRRAALDRDPDQVEDQSAEIDEAGNDWPAANRD
jgi:hypothetical protein